MLKLQELIKIDIATTSLEELKELIKNAQGNELIRLREIIPAINDILLFLYEIKLIEGNFNAEKTRIM